MARADVHTLLPLDRWATIMGVDPVRFNAGAQINLATGETLFPILNSVQGLWPQFSWQASDQISREQLAQEIAYAEKDVADFLGYWPAPQWIAQEMHVYPRHMRRDVFTGGQNVRGMYKSIKAKWAKFIAAGRRATIDPSTDDNTVALVYSSPDLDAFNEIATVTLATIDSSITDVCELKVYFEGHEGDQTYEIRPPRTATLVGNTFTATFWTWQLILPTVQDRFATTEPTNSALGIDLTDTDNLEDNVVVLHEFTDFTQASAVHYWEAFPQHALVPIAGFCGSCGGTGCAACELISQDGCIHLRDQQAGIVVPVPATFDEDTAQWNQVAWTECREPDNVKIYYYSGELSESYLRSETCNTMKPQLERAIAYIATARLKRPPAANNNVTQFIRNLQTDIALTPEGGGSRTVDFGDLASPFGTRHGEVWAWKQLKHFADKIPSVGVLA